MVKIKIPFLNLEISKSGEVSSLVKKVNSLEDAYLQNRPTLDFLESMGQGVVKIPRLEVPYRDMVDLARYSDIMRNIIFALKSELFRNDFLIEPSFVKKCPSEECATKYDFDLDVCEKCGTFLIEPSHKEKESFEELIKRANINGQTLIEVFKEIEEDLAIGDNGFILLNMDYGTNEEGEIILKELVEIIRADPGIMRIVADKFGRRGLTDDGKRAMTCLDHRKELLFDQDTCNKCFKKTYPVHYSAFYNTGAQTTPIYYIEGEIIHVSKYKPSLLYGSPPIIAVWQKVHALLDMDRWIKDAYGLQRPPKGVFLVNTSNTDTVKKAWEWMLSKLKQNNHAIHPFVIENKESNKGKFAEYISFMPNLTEMQFTEVREEMRRSVGAVYGVMPLFTGDMSNSGGLNNEGLQVTVTNRAVEAGQNIYNKKVIPEILKVLGINNWNIILAPSEEKDEMAETQRNMADAQYATLMRNMGFEVTRNPQGEFEYSDKPVNPPTDTGGLTDFMNEQSQGIQGMPDTKKTAIRNSSDYRKEIEKEIEELIKNLDLKRKIPEEKLKEKIENLIERFKNRLVGKSNKQLEDAYSKSIERVEKQLNVNIVDSGQSAAVLNAVKNSDVYTGAFSGLTKSMSLKLNSVIREAYSKPKEFSIDKIVKNMSDVVEASDSQLEAIARTETHNISTLAKGEVYKQLGDKVLVKWINPEDYRTTDICHKIKRRTESGVTINKLKEIIKEEADPNIYRSDRPFTPHINCRSDMVSSRK